MAEKDYYSILGLKRNANEQDIKSAFRKLSKKYHPDICKEDGAEEKFKEINEAYTVLSDPEKKQMYDIYGTIDPNGLNFGNMGGGFSPFGGFDPFNPFGHFRQGTGTSQMKERGEDLRITVNVSFDDIFYGAHKKIKMTKKCACHRCNGSGSETNETVTCPRCHGSGTVTETTRRGNMVMQNIGVCPDCHGTGQIIKEPCPHCHGTGLESKQVDVEFDIPAGMYENAYFIVKGKGNDAPHRGIPGDLLVLIKEKPSTNGLKRDENNNILYTARVPYKTMVFGGDISVPYIGNTSKTIHVNTSTESGKVVKLFSLGFPDPNQPSVRANYIITLECEIPKPSELSPELKNALKNS